MTKSRNVAVTTLSFDALSRLMNIPDGQHIVRAEYAIELDCLRILIEGDGLPATSPGCPAQEIYPAVKNRTVTEFEWSTFKEGAQWPAKA